MAKQSPQHLLEKLLHTAVILNEDWEALSAEDRASLAACTDAMGLIDRLVKAGLLTEYQGARVSVGKTYGLVLGNYRVLDRIGAGGMGVVYRAEHQRMRRPVAVKVLSLGHAEAEGAADLLHRFFAEMRAVAKLQHPNIINAIDAGEVHSPNPDMPVLYYYVMEYVPGSNLEDLVLERGPMTVEQACDVGYQVAAALAEAHKHNLVHRDIKPANILVTPENQAKLLDFGLARHFGKRMTEPGTVMGTVDYMAPEQVRDASDVDIRADIYSLGGTLFWCLTGSQPFPSGGNIERDLIARLTQPAPSLRDRRPDLPEPLDEILGRMMATEPADRYAHPQQVMEALLGVLKEKKAASKFYHFPPSPLQMTRHPTGQDTARLRPPAKHLVLIVDDEDDIRTLCQYALKAEDLECEGVDNGLDGLAMLKEHAFDLVLLDADLPGMSGADVLRELRHAPPSPHLKVIMISGRSSADEMAQMLQAGADDYLTKPFSLVQLQARVRAALRLKSAQDHVLDAPIGHAPTGAAAGLSSRPSDPVVVESVLQVVLTKLMEHRQIESVAHARRLQLYCAALAEEAAALPLFAAVIDQGFSQTLRGCIPFHDIGMLALPDHLLQEQGRLSAHDRIFMQAHVTLGAEVLQEVAHRYGPQFAFLPMALEVVRSHHERFDGSGYPDGLVGDAIPLPARLLAPADVYDALRCRRSYKPALSHAAALHIITQESAAWFDPAILSVLPRCAAKWEKIFQDEKD